MKKNLIMMEWLIILILSGCENEIPDSITNELQISQEDLAEEEYIEGTIPIGSYYMNGDTSRTDWSFYIDEQGMSYFLLDKNQKHAVGTYDYDPDTGIYTFDYFREDLMGIDHIIEEGYFIDEDCRIVLIKIAMVEGDIVHVLSELKTEYIRVSE